MLGQPAPWALKLLDLEANALTDESARYLAAQLVRESREGEQRGAPCVLDDEWVTYAADGASSIDIGGNLAISGDGCAAVRAAARASCTGGRRFAVHV